MWMRWIVTTVITTLLAGCVVYAYNKGRQSGMQEVQTLWDSEKLATAQAQAEELMKARQRESALHDLAARLRKEKRDESLRLSRQHAADLERLRDRPDTRAGAGGVPEGASPGVGCTGAGLAKLDAQLLAGYAHSAARLQSAYDECKAKYDAVAGGSQWR